MIISGKSGEYYSKGPGNRYKVLVNQSKLFSSNKIISEQTQIRQIELSLKEIGFHPNFLAERENEFETIQTEFIKSVNGNTKEFFKLMSAGNREANLVWTTGTEMSLLQSYYPARVTFLSELVKYISGLSIAKPRIADDGCGTGVDIYCLNKIFGNKVELIGFDPNIFALEKADARSPKIDFQKRLNGLFDVVYSNFVYWDNGMSASDIAAKREEWSLALKNVGLLIQNIDFDKYERDAYTYILSQSFKLIRDERIQEVKDNKDCHILVFEKK